MRATARRPMRRRVRGGQIATDRTVRSIWASRAKPMGRIRLRLQRISRVHSRTIVCGSPDGNPESAMPRLSEPRRTESGDRRSLSRSCGHRGGRRSGGSPRGALQTSVSRPTSNPGATVQPLAPLVRLPAEGTIVPKLGSRSRTQGSGRPTRSAGLGSGSTQTSTATLTLR